MSSCNPCDDNISIILDTGSQGPQGPVGPIADVFNYEFVLMAGDTIISGTDNSGKDFTYNPNSLQVHINGVLLSATDYTATDGTSIVLNEAAANNNDLAQISTQVKPEGSDDIPSEIDRIDGEIADLDARVTTTKATYRQTQMLLLVCRRRPRTLQPGTLRYQVYHPQEIAATNYKTNRT